MKTHRRKMLKNAVCCVLATTLALPFGLLSPKAFAENSQNTPTSERTQTAEIPNDYPNYIEHSTETELPAYGTAFGQHSIGVTVTDFKANDNRFEITEFEGESGVVCRTDGEGEISWEFNVRNSGSYGLCMTYFLTAASMKAGIRIDGEYPFYEARNVELTRYWHSKTTAIQYDSRNKNQKRPPQVLYNCWTDQPIKDTSGRFGEPYRFYLTSGRHTLTIEGVKPEFYLKNISFCDFEELPLYESIMPTHEETDATPALTNGETILVEAELPKYTNSGNLYPTYDRTDCTISPSHPVNRRYNTIGADTWNKSGQMIVYEAEVPYDGYYTLNIKCRQNAAYGMSSGRRVYVNGKVPCRELDNIRIPYSPDWQTITPTAENGEPIYIKLPAGKNTIAFEAVLGNIGETAQRIDDIISRLNSDLDKGITDTFPEAADELSEEAEKIEGSAAAVSLEALAGSLKAAAKRPEKLPTMEAGLRRQLSGLSVQTSELRSAPLEMDYFEIKTVHEEFRSAKANLFKQIDFGFKAFIGSFFEDYSAVSEDTSKNAVDVITCTDAERADVLWDLVANGFTAEHDSRVNVNMVRGSVLEEILAGQEADIALFVDVETVYALAERGLTANLKDIYGYNEVEARVPERLAGLCEYNGGVYGIPLTESPTMMFLRTDVLERVGIEAPETWNELCEALPELKRRGLRIGLAEETDLSALPITVRDVFAVSDFEDTIRMFRTGEMPIVIRSHTEFADTLLEKAPEISGRWSVGALPDGFTNVSEPDCLFAVIFNDRPDNLRTDWELLDWFTEADIQAQFGQAWEGVSGKRYPAALEK